MPALTPVRPALLAPALFTMAVVLLGLAPFAAAKAEPQILALIATEAPKPLTCAGGECFVELTSFCMEPARQSPTHATAYHATDGAALTLVAKTAAGGELRLPLGAEASYMSQRGFTAVRVSLPKATLDRLGAADARVEVGRHVALLPLPDEDYKRPHEQEEIAAALGPNRLVGEEIVDRGGKTADGARFLSYLINALPEDGAVDPGLRAGLWDRVAGRVPAGLQQTGRTYAERSFAGCLDKVVEAEGRISLRQCLQAAHDKNIWTLNKRYWRAVKPQS